MLRKNNSVIARDNRADERILETALRDLPPKPNDAFFPLKKRRGGRAIFGVF